MTKAPAIATRPLTSVPIDCLPRSTNGGTSNARAPAATISAAAPERLPLIAARPAAKIINAPARAPRPLASVLSDNAPMSATEAAILAIATERSIKPAAWITSVLGSAITATPSATIAATMIPRPLPAVLRSIFPNALITPTRSLRPAATTTSPAPVRMIEGGTKFMAKPIATSEAATAAKPLPMVDQSILPKSFTALARTFIARAIATMPMPARIIPAELAERGILAAETVARRTATPVRPLASSSQLNLDSA